MRASTRSWLGAGLLNLIIHVDAVPGVDVALRTSFGAPPYLVELLETAAEENATAYFPLLDRIADGYFDASTTDYELYTAFRGLLQEEGHISRAEDLSSFDFALAIRSTAPRIESHYQYYNTSAPLSKDEECDTWLYVPFNGQKFCSPDLNEANAHAVEKVSSAKLRLLPFDRVLGDASSEWPSVLYSDITSTSFRAFYKTLSKTADVGKTSLIVRYKPSKDGITRPFTVSGYGVELALKRTDYIVIDDRQAEQEAREIPVSEETTLSEDEMSDLRPLSSSELRGLGMKAASFVQSSDSPFDTLYRLLQDFPKHSAVVAGVNISDDIVQEHLANREVLLPSGNNMLWINGVQVMPRDVDAYSLLEFLRKERRTIRGIRELGLSAPEAVDLLAHEAITTSQTGQEAQRYDWRDDNEGGNVILWLNDIEKDKRYAEWPASVTALLQRTYPGQLPAVRRDLHNLLMPIDLADAADVELLVDGIQNYVKRLVPIRFGLVPTAPSAASADQAKIVYYLVDRYGLGAVLSYLELSVVGAGRKYGAPQEKYFTKVIEERQLRKNRAILSFEEILTGVDGASRLSSSADYLHRLGHKPTSPSIFINGVPIAKTDEWLQAMSQRIGQDIRVLQEAVYRGTVTDNDYLPDLFLMKASLRRNALISPEEDNQIRHLDLGILSEIADLPSLPFSEDTIERELIHVTIIDDFDTLKGFSHLMEALIFKRQHDNVELAVLHARSDAIELRRKIQDYETMQSTEVMQTLLYKYDSSANMVLEAAGVTAPDELSVVHRQSIIQTIFDSFPENNAESSNTWPAFSEVINSAGPKAVLINGRVVGPIPLGAELVLDDFESLLSYERRKRLLPAALVIEGMKLTAMAATPSAFARVSNLIALSRVNDIPEGIFETPSTARTSKFKSWTAEYTAIKLGDAGSANIQIFASIDPASETAQRWLPIISTFSKLDGVYVCLFLNPKERLDELPIKRFYRHVLKPKPTFTSDGALEALSAKFSGLPADALLNMGMDLPPSWQVAPSDSVHDLDNIKLSAPKSGHDIEAVYELEHILIEGHSRDASSGPPPRGAQLVLGTQLDPHFAATIVMANLGYFQFKANPGIYNLGLKSGRSEEIFKIDSAGSKDNTQTDDGTSEIALMSFRGVTLYPRLSRKPGMEEEDVLEASKSGLESLAEGADRLLAQAGIHNVEASKLINQAAKFGSSLFSSSVAKLVTTSHHADINIFSVASGHLYERMLNIMMLSVMKHTKHTVKFWFIEQFLSPSFKDFLPAMAEEYGFRYEMVAYKWPHWLRGQKEKQREIWGYKILFLDVLFPLDLDKVIFVDADQIVRTDMYELVEHDLKGAPYGFTPMCDSRTEMEGFRFWKQGYWKNFLRGLPYHISALYVVDLKKFRQIAAGDRLRQQYHQLSADPASLSNLDQDLPNHMQMALPIHSLPQEWLWCETWCSDEALKNAKTIDLCNNPQTKEPKLDRARRQVPEWTVYDDEIAAVANRHKLNSSSGKPIAGDAGDAGLQGQEEESIQEKLQREDAEKEKKKKQVRDEL
nr:udp-glucose:glycoprotein glucosyltransferase [Quercus suber]